MSKGTTHRAIRITDELWDQAKQAAAAQEQNLSDIIRTALRQYVNDWKDHPPKQ